MAHGAITVSDPAMRRRAATMTVQAFGANGRDVTILAQGLDSGRRHIILVDTGRTFGRYASLVVGTDGLYSGLYADDVNDANAQFIRRVMR